MAPRRILVVLYHYPPAATVGAARWLAQAKYLRRLGHEVTILTTNAFGSRSEDEAEGVVRARDLAGSPATRRLLGRTGSAPAGTAPEDEKPVPQAIRRLFVPDPQTASWLPWAVQAARRLVREREIECVVTSSPQHAAHFVGLALRRRVPWIADFRDGWTFEPMRPPFYIGLQRRLDARFERAVVRGADRVFAVSRPLVEDFRTRFGVEAVYIPNAWDPELVRELPGPLPELDPERRTLVHTGALTGPWGRDPAPLLDALRQLTDPRLHVILAGPPAEARLVGEHGLTGIARHVGRLPRATALALQRRADALLLVTSPHTSEATGKLAEYLGSRRPIIALAAGNEAARIIAETGTGVAVSPQDPGSIRAALSAAAAGDLPYAPRGLDRYVFPESAEAVAAEIQRAVRDREGAAF
jgi:glycosyltransferase involved in cell wall biosynthesis